MGPPGKPGTEVFGNFYQFAKHGQHVAHLFTWLMLWLSHHFTTCKLFGLEVVGESVFLPR